MKHNITYLLITLILSVFGANAANLAGEWKLHPSFDQNVTKIIDTQDRTFMLAPAQDIYPSVSLYATPYLMLYSLDKETDEFRHLNSSNYLSGNILSTIAYNPEKGYLLCVFDDGNIDLLYDDNSVVNIPGLKSANLPISKSVNSINFDADNNRAYLATDFGYIVVDDKKGQIVESHIYNFALTSVARIGSSILAVKDAEVYASPTSDHQLSFSDFTKVSNANPVTSLVPLSGNKGALTVNKDLYTFEMTEANELANLTKKQSGLGADITRSRAGYVYSNAWNLGLLAMDGTVQLIGLPEEARSKILSTWDANEFWFNEPRKGLASIKTNQGEWTYTRQPRRPNAAAAFRSLQMAYNPTYGMLTINAGMKRPFSNNTIRIQPLISGLKDNKWSVYSPAYFGDEYKDVCLIPNGLAVDPDDDKYIYSGSYYSGITRFNLEDPTDVLPMSHPSDAASSLPNFNVIIEDNSGWKDLCQFGPPAFDNSGNLWVTYDRQINSTGFEQVWVWPKSDRRNSNVSGWKHFNVSNYTNSYCSLVLPLKHSNNKNLVVLLNGVWEGPVWVLNHKGTLSTYTDDVVATMSTVYDQDGSPVTKNYPYCAYEDPDTGYVWVSSYNGVFYFNPTQAFTDPTRVNRIKVPRNDGTQLADYLLDNVAVYQITGDPQGRKWFATNGGGLVCTSSDGKDVLAEFTTENSNIPDNIVYSVAYNPANNSIFVSTASGYAEFFPAGSSSGDNLSNVRAYPNPVRPDFLGWVTIDGLTDNALVKITDASGNIVKELGLASGGQAQWDMCNSHMQRVAAGVYYVLVSGGPDGGSSAKATKILVIN